MHKFRVSFLFMAMTLLLTSAWVAAGTVSSDNVNAPLTNQVTVSSDKGQPLIVLKLGDTLRVKLLGNPTTGYEWRMADDCSAATLLQYVATGYAPQMNLVGASGSGGEYTFSYVAQTIGNGELKMTYNRAWEIGVPPIQTFTLAIRVE